MRRGSLISRRREKCLLMSLLKQVEHRPALPGPIEGTHGTRKDSSRVWMNVASHQKKDKKTRKEGGRERAD